MTTKHDFSADIGSLIAPVSVDPSFTGVEWRWIKRFVLQTLSTESAKSKIRILLFLYVSLIICPIQYWPLAAYTDSTWYFAVNYAATHHLVVGRDFVFTSGPLSYLAVPQDIGNNLATGLACQALLWLLAIAIMWKLFFRSGFRLLNLAFFSFFLGFSGQLYQYPTPLGSGDLLLTCALILLLLFHLRGSLEHYIPALAMMGLIPLIKFVGLLSVAGVLGGLIAYRMVDQRRGRSREILLALTGTSLVAIIGLRLSMGSFATLAQYFRVSMELSSGYNLAMSAAGSPVEILAALEALLLLVLAFRLVASGNSRTAWFLTSVLAIPLFLSFKHGFVRQDVHVMHYFCFVAIAMALAALSTSFNMRSALIFGILLLLFTVLWQDNVARNGFRAAVAAVTGIRTPFIVGSALDLHHLQQILEAKGEQAFPPELHIEPEIRAIVGSEPVASLSMAYNNAYLDGLNLVLYPVIQRYSAYTPYLDQWNARWIDDQGPRFLIFDGNSIDGRHPWAETPAMWTEIYRWYELRLLGPRNLLLERRLQPRFERFKSLGHFQVTFGQPIQIPPAPQPAFWALECSLSKIGRLRELFFRVPEVTMKVDKANGESKSFRVLLSVVGSPSPGTNLPSDLAEFAAFFGTVEDYKVSVTALNFGGPGKSAYNRNCDLQFLQPVR